MSWRLARSIEAMQRGCSFHGFRLACLLTRSEVISSKLSPNFCDSSSCHWMVKRSGAEDEDPLDDVREAKLLHKQAGHDRLAGAGVVGEQEAQHHLRQHPLVDRLELVRQHVDARQRDSKVRVVCERETNARRLDEQEEVVRQGRSFATSEQRWQAQPRVGCTIGVAQLALPGAYAKVDDSPEGLSLLDPHRPDKVPGKAQRLSGDLGRKLISVTLYLLESSARTIIATPRSRRWWEGIMACTA